VRYIKLFFSKFIELWMIVFVTGLIFSLLGIPIPVALILGLIPGALYLKWCANRDDNNAERIANLSPETVSALPDHARNRATPATDSPSAADEISRLADLLNQGLLTPAEFEQAKRRALE
jgi:Short C-terminal domain